MTNDLDPEPLLKALKKATSFEVFLISFLTLPFVFNAWLGIADHLKLTRREDLFVIPSVLLLYVAGMVMMFIGNSKARKREIARDQILSYLNGKEFRMMSYERIRSNISNDYDDEFLAELPAYFPNSLRRAVLKGGKKGLARIYESNITDAG
jgi:hypothetical protein